MTLEALAARYDLPAASVSRFTVLLERLADPAAPTTVHAGEEAVDVHVADSLSGLAVPALRSAARVADLGSGAGFPALVLAVVLPDVHVTAVESVGR